MLNFLFYKKIKFKFYTNRKKETQQRDKMRRKIILDTDPGVDDAYAIQFLLNADVDILAFTT